MQISWFRPILLALGLTVLSACATTMGTLPNQMRTCRDLVVQMPERSGLTFAQLEATSILQEAAFWKCNKRVEETSSVAEED